jgi:hypothetical protein
VFLSQLAATSTEFIRAVRRVRSSFAPFLFLVWCPNHRLTPRHGAASFCRWGSRRRFEDWLRRTRELAPPHFSRFSLSLVITHLLNFSLSPCVAVQQPPRRCPMPVTTLAACVAIPGKGQGRQTRHCFQHLLPHMVVHFTEPRNDRRSTSIRARNSAVVILEQHCHHPVMASCLYETCCLVYT